MKEAQINFEPGMRAQRLKDMYLEQFRLFSDVDWFWFEQEGISADQVLYCYSEQYVKLADEMGWSPWQHKKDLDEFFTWMETQILRQLASTLRLAGARTLESSEGF